MSKKQLQCSEIISKSVCTQKHNRGFTILIATLVAAVVLAIGLSILSITTKQVQLAGIARQSEIAFQAASAALECVRFNDVNTDDGGVFDVTNPQTGYAEVTCFGVKDTVSSDSDSDGSGGPSSGENQKLDFTWGDAGDICSKIELYKFYDADNAIDLDTYGITAYDCPAGTACTLVKARGYNKRCGDINTEGAIERELTIIY